MTRAEQIRNTVNNVLSEFGGSLTLRKRTASRDDQDDVTYSSTDSTITGYVAVGGEEDELEDMGALDKGEAVAYVLYDSNVEEKDWIKYDGSWYEVRSVSHDDSGQNSLFQSCSLALAEE